MGRRLPSAGELLIIRQPGKRVSRLTLQPGYPEFFGVPARKPGHSKAGSDRNVVRRNAVVAEIRVEIPKKAIS